MRGCPHAHRQRACTDCFAITTSYQPGVFGSKNETRQRRRRLAEHVRVDPRRPRTASAGGSASAPTLTHLLAGHLVPARVADDHCRGAVHDLVRELVRRDERPVRRDSVRPGPDESESSIVSVCRSWNVRVARADDRRCRRAAATAAAVGTRHVAGFLPPISHLDRLRRPRRRRRSRGSTRRRTASRRASFAPTPERDVEPARRLVPASRATDAWSFSGLPGTTPSARTSSPAWRLKTTAPAGGAGNAGSDVVLAVVASSSTLRGGPSARSWRWRGRACGARAPRRSRRPPRRARARRSTASSRSQTAPSSAGAQRSVAASGARDVAPARLEERGQPDRQCVERDETAHESAVDTGSTPGSSTPSAAIAKMPIAPALAQLAPPTRCAAARARARTPAPRTRARPRAGSSDVNA